MSERAGRGAAVLVCVAIASAGGAAAAQEPGGRTLGQAVESAAAARLSMRIAQARVESARARAAQAKALLYPSLDLLTNFDRIQNYDTFTGITASVEIPQLNTTSTVDVTQQVPRYQAGSVLQARYDAYTGGRNEAQLQRFERALEAAEVARRAALQDLTVEVANAYFRLRQACLRHDAATRRLQGAQRSAEQAQARLREGRIPEIEHSAALLALTESRSELRARAGELEDAYADYAATLREGDPGADAAPERCRFAGAVEADLAEARRLSDDTLAARYHALRVEEARQAVEVERGALRPQVSVYARYSGIARSNDSFNDALGGFKRRQASIGLQMSFNLFDAGLTRQRMAELQSEADRRQLEAERALADREQARRRAEIRVRLAGNRAELARARLDLAQARTRVARERLQSDTVTRTALEEQVDREADAQDELQQSELELAIARLATLFPSSPVAGASDAPVASPGTASVPGRSP